MQTPQREWIANDLRKYINHQIDKVKSSKFNTWFNLQEIDKEWNKYLNGDNQSSFHIWQLVNFALLID